MSRNWYKWSKWTYFPFFKTILQTEDWDVSRFNFQLLIGFILSLQNKYVYTYTWELLRCSINISWKVPIHQLGSSDPSWFIGIFQLMFLWFPLLSSEVRALYGFTCPTTSHIPVEMSLKSPWTNTRTSAVWILYNHSSPCGHRANEPQVLAQGNGFYKPQISTMEVTQDSAYF